MKKSKIYRTDVHFGYEVPKYDTNDIFDKAITTEKLDEGAVEWKNLSGDVQNIIASREEGGVALSNDWGDSELIGITQKKLTEAHEEILEIVGSGIGELGTVITNEEMDEVLGGDPPVYLVDANGNAVLDEQGKPVEII